MSTQHDSMTENNTNHTDTHDLAGGRKPKAKPFMLRLDTATMEAVEKWAADEFRSTNGQLQWIVTEALRKNGRLPKKQQR